MSLSKGLDKPPVRLEVLEFVIKRRSANHSWRPSSKAVIAVFKQREKKWVEKYVTLWFINRAGIILIGFTNKCRQVQPGIEP